LTAPSRRGAGTVHDPGPTERMAESYMMDPEASVSALVFHHPEARYFNV
jgi:hypothetical protein